MSIVGPTMEDLFFILIFSAFLIFTSISAMIVAESFREKDGLIERTIVWIGVKFSNYSFFLFVLLSFVWLSVYVLPNSETLNNIYVFVFLTTMFLMFMNLFRNTKQLLLLKIVLNKLQKQKGDTEEIKIILASNGNIIKIKDDWDTYGMLAGEVYVVGFKNGKLVALPKHKKEASGLEVDDDEDYDIIGNVAENENLIPDEYTKEEIDHIVESIGYKY